MSYSYVVTSQRSTAVSHSIVCNFTSATDRNLIVARGNHLQIQTIREDSIVLEEDVPLFGHILSLDHYRPSDSDTNQDVLFILTKRKNFCVLAYDSVAKKVLTRTVGSVKDRAGREIEKQNSFSDPQGRMIGMLLYEGQLKVLPIDSLGMSEAFNLPLHESTVIDMVFLHGCAHPTVCMLSEDSRRARHLRTFVVDVTERELLPGPWSQNNMEFGASTLVPVPVASGAGVLVLGACSVTYVSGNKISGQQQQVQAVEMTPAMLCAYCQLTPKGDRFLLADHRGDLSALVLHTESTAAGVGAAASGSTSSSSSADAAAPVKVTALTTDHVGSTSTAETLSLLGDGLVFVGSTLGDSMLIQLHAEKDEQGSNLEVLEIQPNIGPVLDMCLVDNDAQGGQRQLVTCSGAYQNGSLRVIRSGVGVHEQASLEVQGIKGVWSLRPQWGSEFDKFLVQSFIGETRVLSIEDEELAEIEIAGFSSDEPTLYCGNMLNDTMVQVTARGVRLVHCSTLQLLHEFSAPCTVTVAAGSPSQLVLALSGGELLYLEQLQQGGETGNSRISLVQVASRMLDQDVACLSIRPLTPASDRSNGNNNSNAIGGGEMEIEGDGSGSDSQTRGTLVAVGTWTDSTVRMLAVPTLDDICCVHLGTNTQARSVLLAALGGKAMLLVGLGDGRLITYNLDFSSGSLPALSNKRDGVLGTHPISFSCFENNGSLCVFASCDRPTVIYLKNGKVLFSVLDLSGPHSDVTGMAPFHSELFPGCLAMCSETALLIGEIEDIQKVHIQKIALQETPRRITHCASAKTYVVLTEKIMRTQLGEESVQRVLFLDDSSMQQFASFELDRLEHGISCATCAFPVSSTDDNPVVATAAGSSAQAQTTSSSSSSSSSSSQPSAAAVKDGGESGDVAAHEAPVKEYIVVGTAHVINDELEPSRGRILVFEVSSASSSSSSSSSSDAAGSTTAAAAAASAGVDRRVAVVAERETRGAVYSLANICGKLAVGLGSKINIYSLVNKDAVEGLASGQSELQYECGQTGHITTLFLRASRDTLLVGDLVRSLTVLRYNPAIKALEEVARDFNSNYLRSIAIMEGSSGRSEQTYFGSDTEGNLFALQYQADAASDEERMRLETCAEFHLGDDINVFRAGTLISQPIDGDQIAAVGSDGAGTGISATAAAAGVAGGYVSVLDNNYTSVTGLGLGSSSLLFGTVAGSIGNIIALSRESYLFFNTLQRVMRTIVPPVGGLNHLDWRMFRNELRSAPQRQVVDGDLVETLLDLPQELLERVTLALNSELNISLANTSASGSALKAGAGGVGDAGGAAAAAGLNASPSSAAAVGAGVATSGAASVDTAAASSSSSSAGALLASIAGEKLALTVEDVVRRVEDMARLH